jgi:hypothetical protein
MVLRNVQEPIVMSYEEEDTYKHPVVMVLRNVQEPILLGFVVVDY